MAASTSYGPRQLSHVLDNTGMYKSEPTSSKHAMSVDAASTFIHSVGLSETNLSSYVQFSRITIDLHDPLKTILLTAAITTTSVVRCCVANDNYAPFLLSPLTFWYRIPKRRSFHPAMFRRWRRNVAAALRLRRRPFSEHRRGPRPDDSCDGAAWRISLEPRRCS